MKRARSGSTQANKAVKPQRNAKSKSQPSATTGVAPDRSVDLAREAIRSMIEVPAPDALGLGAKPASAQPTGLEEALTLARELQALAQLPASELFELKSR